MNKKKTYTLSEGKLKLRVAHEEKHEILKLSYNLKTLLFHKPFLLTKKKKN